MGKPTEVIVVEDNSRARSALAAYMSLHAGIRITGEASNGLEAISKIKNSPPDIVLMDIQMPVMDGLEATKIIKKRWPWVKVIALTMYQSYKSKAILAGADAFLEKGCTGSELISTVNKLMQTNANSSLQP